MVNSILRNEAFQAVAVTALISAALLLTVGVLTVVA